MSIYLSLNDAFVTFNSESGQMCAIKEVRLVSDDQTSKESLKQLHQVFFLSNCLWLNHAFIIIIGVLVFILAVNFKYVVTSSPSGVLAIDGFLTQFIILNRR